MFGFFLCALELTLIWSLLFSTCFLLMLECHVTSLLFLQWFLPSTCLLGWCCASFCLSNQDGIVADESQNLQFMSSQSMKLPPSNSALPNQALGSIAGLGMQNLNSVRQVSPHVYFRLSVEWFVEAINSLSCAVTVFKLAVWCGNELLVPEEHLAVCFVEWQSQYVWCWKHSSTTPGPAAASSTTSQFIAA